MDSTHRTLKFYGYLLIVVLIGITLAFIRPSPVLSDSDLTQAVNAAFIPRTEDPALHELAHQRALQASVDFSHTGATTAEVLAYNSGFADPIATVISQWLGSPAHAALLSDPSFTSIGCGAVTTSDGTYYAACLLGVSVSITDGNSSLQQPTTDSTPPVTVQSPPPIGHLPNTAMRNLRMDGFPISGEGFPDSAECVL